MSLLTVLGGKCNRGTTTIPLLRSWKIFFGWGGLQIFRAYGAVGDQLNVPSKAEVQRQRRDIFVENPSQKKYQPQRGGISGESFFAGFENIFRVVFHAEFLQQCDVFLAE
jgi:hypothetical protein